MHTGYELLWMAAERTPMHPALIDDRTDRRLTYAELIAEVDAVAAGFAARGIGRGVRVAIALPGVWEHCIAILALMRLNAVPAVLNFRLKPDEIAGLCRTSEVDAAIIQPDPALTQVIEKALPDGAPIWAVGAEIGSARSFAACRADAASLGTYEKPAKTDIAFLF